MDLYESKYGQRVDAPVINTAIDLLSKHYQPPEGPLRILDIGCGDMKLTQQFIDLLTAHITKERDIHLEGWDVSKKGIGDAQAKGYDASIMDITQPLPEKQPTEHYDMIVFLEVLEHIAATDTAILNIRSLLKPNGILVLSTPNLASWYNRIFLLFGQQPHCTEVSDEPTRFGNQITHKIFGDDPREGGNSAGHLRVFAWKALKEFLDYHGYVIIDAKGCANHQFDLITRAVAPLFPGLAGDICLIAEKKAP